MSRRKDWPVPEGWRSGDNGTGNFNCPRCGYYCSCRTLEECFRPLTEREEAVERAKLDYMYPDRVPR